MADSSRDDRHLMRQRGAGLRNANNVDFDFNFRAHDTREERQLMRQRGAGIRKIDNISFGFSFPTPSQSRRSSRILRSAEKGATRSSETPTTSKRLISAASNALQETVVGSLRLSLHDHGPITSSPGAQTSEVPNSSKRRRLNKDSRNDNFVHHLSPGASRTRQGSNFVLAEDEDGNEVILQNQLTVSGNKSAVEGHRNLSPAPGAFSDNDKENFVIQNATPKSVSKNSASKPTRQGQYQPPLLQVDTVNQPLNDVDLVLLEATSMDMSSTNAAVAAPLTGKSDFSDARLGPSGAESKATEPAKKRRKKRKSVVLRARKLRPTNIRQTSITSISSSATTNGYSETVPNSDEEIEHEKALANEDSSRQDPMANENPTSEEVEETQASEPRVPLWKRLATRRAQKRRNRLSVSASPPPQTRDDEEADGTYVEEDGSPEPITPAARRRKAADGAGRKATITKAESRSKNASGRKSFPIVTYRITNAHTLPTIEEGEREDLSDVGEDIMYANFSTHQQPNAVDILAQICRETLESSVETLETNATEPHDRSQLKQKRIALEAFGETLDQQLFLMSEAVEQRITLEARLRKSKREKAELQARWTEIRRQRDELALRADNIRRENWEDEETKRKEFEISELAHKAEIGLARADMDDNDENDNNLEFMLRYMADRISGATGQGGMLNKVKAFNSHLESLATLLEGRQRP